MDRRFVIIGLLIFGAPAWGFAQTVPATTVDLIIEADTYVPAFYRGRREPTSGSQIRAIAIVPPDKQYSYRWELDGRALSNGAAVPNQRAITFTAPIGSRFRIGVDVYDQEGQKVGEQEEYISTSDPQTYFFEDSLLYGIRPVAISDTYVLSGDEVTIRAVPYFMDEQIFAIGHQLRWIVNGREVLDEQSSEEDLITLRRASGSGTASIGFTLRNERSLTQYANGSFTLEF